MGWKGPAGKQACSACPTHQADPLSASAATLPGTAITHSHSHTQSHKLNVHTHKPRCTSMHIYKCPHTRTYTLNTHSYTNTLCTHSRHSVHLHTLRPTLSCVYTHTLNTLTCTPVHSRAYTYAHMHTCMPTPGIHTLSTLTDLYAQTRTPSRTCPGAGLALEHQATCCR